MFSLHALAQQLLHFAGRLEPQERAFGDLEVADELEWILGAPALLDEVAVGGGQRGEEGVDRRVADRLLTFLQRRAQVDQLRLRDLHERRAVERRAYVEPHPALVLVMRALVLDRAEPRVERVAHGALVIHGGGELAGLDPALRDSVLLFRELGFAPRCERSDVDLDALLADPGALVNLERFRPVRRHVDLDHDSEPITGLRQVGVEPG